MGVRGSDTGMPPLGTHVVHEEGVDARVVTAGDLALFEPGAPATVVDGFDGPTGAYVVGSFSRTSLSRASSGSGRSWRGTRASVGTSPSSSTQPPLPRSSRP